MFVKFIKYSGSLAAENKVPIQPINLINLMNFMNLMNFINLTNFQLEPLPHSRAPSNSRYQPSSLSSSPDKPIPPVESLEN